MGRVVVKEERCKACCLCTSVCRRGLLSLDPGRRNGSGYEVVKFAGPEECTGCALCAEMCPDVALEVYR